MERLQVARGRLPAVIASEAFAYDARRQDLVGTTITVGTRSVLVAGTAGDPADDWVFEPAALAPL
jgi:hypothetical protein